MFQGRSRTSCAHVGPEYTSALLSGTVTYHHMRYALPHSVFAAQLKRPRVVVELLPALLEESQAAVPCIPFGKAPADESLELSCACSKSQPMWTDSKSTPTPPHHATFVVDVNPAFANIFLTRLGVTLVYLHFNT